MCVVHSFYTHLLLLHSCVHMIQSYLSKKLSGYILLLLLLFFKKKLCKFFLTVTGKCPQWCGVFLLVGSSLGKIYTPGP